MYSYIHAMALVVYFTSDKVYD